MISHNGRGRSYATCDGDDCDANVIDLPLDVDATNRILKTFFGWTSSVDLRHFCKKCAPPARKRRNYWNRHSGGFSGNTVARVYDAE